MISILPGLLVAFIAAGIFVRLLATPALARLVLDIPNDRSLHAVPTPRTGGVGLLLGCAVAWVFAGGASLLPLVAGLAALLGVLFFIDDVRGLSVPVRFASQFAAAIAFVLASGPYALWLMPLLVLGIVWSMNLYNFMDGANGFAGGMAAFGFGAYAIAANAAGANDLALAGAIIAGGALGFLLWNFDPARIFLGDAGSIPLGFLASVLGVLGWQREVWPFWFPVLVFSPFVLDATVTLLQRALRGEKLWQAHKTHYYQRLVGMGWSHRQLALAEYALMACVALSALIFRESGWPAVVALIAAWTSVYVTIASIVDQRWVAFQARKGTAKDPG